MLLFTFVLVGFIFTSVTAQGVQIADPVIKPDGFSYKIILDGRANEGPANNFHWLRLNENGEESSHVVTWYEQSVCQQAVCEYYALYPGEYKFRLMVTDVLTGETRTGDIPVTVPEAMRKLTSCVEQAQWVRRETELYGLMDAEAPECESGSGHYEARQCNGMIAMCWCVEKQTGQYVLGTLHPSGLPLDCDLLVSGKDRVGKCQLEVYKKYNFENIFGFMIQQAELDELRPKCDSRGNYEQMQFDEASGCYCVDKVRGHRRPCSHGLCGKE
jgi:hypothetical protein